VKSERPVIHGRDHERGGADTIRIAYEDVGTDAGTGFDIDLSRFVIAEVFGLKHLWAGGHSAIDSGASAMTTLACPIAGVPTPAPFNTVFYDRTIEPTLGSATTAPRYVGLNFEAEEAGVYVYGVQLYRADGASAVDIGLWKSSGSGSDPTTPLATATVDTVGPAWNEAYFSTPYGPLDTGATDRYVVAWHNDTSGDHKQAASASALPLVTETPIIAGTNAGDTTPWRRQLADDGEMPGLATSNDYLVGPILTPEPAVPPFFVVATAAEGTEDGVYVVRCQFTPGEIQIFWSAANVDVAVNVFALGGEA
jgi:hypothetical protein